MIASMILPGLSPFKRGGEDMEARTVSVEDASKALGISRAFAYELIARDEFPCTILRLGRRIVVVRAALDRVLEQPLDHEERGTSNQ